MMETEAFWVVVDCLDWEMVVEAEPFQVEDWEMVVEEIGGEVLDCLDCLDFAAKAEERVVNHLQSQVGHCSETVPNNYKVGQY